jgi:hypothetical protein
VVYALSGALRVEWREIWRHSANIAPLGCAGPIHFGLSFRPPAGRAELPIRDNAGMTSHGNLLAPPTKLPDDPAMPRLAAGDDPTEVAAAYPASSAAWAALAEDALRRGRAVEAYAYARTGYHRGLDSLRRSGWKGSGPVPWAHGPNQGFLRALHALGQAAGAIGEQDEAQRCATFLNDSDPAATTVLQTPETPPAR